MKFLISILLSLYIGVCSAQNISGIKSTQRATTTQRTNTVGFEGLTIYDVTLHKFYFYNGSAWEQMSSYKSITTHTYDLGSLLADTNTSTTFTVTGAAIGDPIKIDVSIDRQGIFIWGYISATNTATVYFENRSNSTVDLASATYTIRRE